MEVQLQELVDKIRKDGVDTAETKAAEILKTAETKAATIIKTAQVEAASIVKNGEAEAARNEKAAISAIRQAGRNLLISFREGITSELDALVKSGIAETYDASVLKELLPSAVKAWIANSESDDIAVLLSPADAAALEGAFESTLKAELAKGIEIRSDASVAGGFRIGTKDGASYYDFSAEAVADLFSAYLNPRVADIMKSAAKEL